MDRNWVTFTALKAVSALFAVSSMAFADDCKVSSEQVDHVKSAYQQLSHEPSQDTAQAFFNQLPARFCEFEQLFGYDDIKGAAPLYELSLYPLFDTLNQYIAPELLAARYVDLAKDAKWQADNVNYLQRAYRQLLLHDTQAVQRHLNRLEPAARTHALAFLLEGPSLKGQRFSQAELQTICEQAAQLCSELNALNP